MLPPAGPGNGLAAPDRLGFVPMESGLSPFYRERTIALLTRHGKEVVLGPALLRGAGAPIETVGDFDTDSLGTFTRDVPRAGSQREAAVRKARIAIERSGRPLGLGSEGAFVPGPFGLVPWNVELVAFVDADLGIEVVGTAHGPGLHVHGSVRTPGELAELAARAGFPEHGLVVRPDGPDDPRIRKGLRTAAALDAAFAEALGESTGGTVFVENDLRAHLHPSRMAMVGRAGDDLAARLAVACPACGRPGFGRAEPVPGLPCGGCGLPTDEPIADTFACVACPCRERRDRPGPATADPARCGWCNP